MSTSAKLMNQLDECIELTLDRLSITGEDTICKFFVNYSHLFSEEERLTSNRKEDIKSLCKARGVTSTLTNSGINLNISLQNCFLSVKQGILYSKLLTE